MLLTGTPTISAWTDITDTDWDAVVTTAGDQTSSPEVAGVITFYPEGTTDNTCAVNKKQHIMKRVNIINFGKFEFRQNKSVLFESLTLTHKNLTTV